MISLPLELGGSKNGESVGLWGPDWESLSESVNITASSKFRQSRGYIWDLPDKPSSPPPSSASSPAPGTKWTALPESLPHAVMPNTYRAWTQNRKLIVQGGPCSRPWGESPATLTKKGLAFKESLYARAYCSPCRIHSASVTTPTHPKDCSAQKQALKMPPPPQRWSRN